MAAAAPALVCARRPVAAAAPRARHLPAFAAGAPRLARAAAFWRRALAIWAGYKAAQLRIGALRAARGEKWAQDQWDRHHAAAGDVGAARDGSTAAARAAGTARLGCAAVC